MSKECKNARNVILGVWLTLTIIMIACSSCGTYTSCAGVDGGRPTNFCSK